MQETPTVSFDPDFAAPADWAAMYRRAGIQIVPAPFPMRSKADKRPALAEWKQFQNETAPDAVFARWFPDNAPPNMGVITGQASGGLICIDLDDYKSGEAAAWWREATLGIDPETWTQQTGGGGRQIFFRLPEGETIGNCRTAIGVDIRGQGGFAMLPPSVHLSQNRYKWIDGCAPWEIEADLAPPHLVAAIKSLIEEHGGSSVPIPGRERTSAPDQDQNAWGKTIDGREAKMARMIWARMISLYEDAPIISKADLEIEARRAFSDYERTTATRLAGCTNAEGLEREGRGWTAFIERWRNAADKWDGEIAQAAKDNETRRRDNPQPSAPAAAVPAAQRFNADTRPEAPATGTFELLNVRQIKTLPDPNWLVKGLVTDNGLGFIFGPPGCGKSFIAIGMALSVACGLPDWWGRPIERSGPVVYISSEGQSDLKFRIAAWEAKTGQKADDAPFFLIRQAINFMAESDVQTLIRTIRLVADQAGELPALVFVDTVSRVLPGADENLQKDMTLFVAACDAVRAEFSATVVGVHHTSRAGNMRGSTVFDGAGDFLAQIEREEREDGERIGVLTARKIKAAEDGWRQTFDLEEVQIGLTATSLFAAPCEERVAAPIPATWPDKSICRLVLGEVEKRARSMAPLSSFPNTRTLGRYFPDVIAQEFGIKPAIAADMLQKWLNSGVLSVAVVDAKTKLKGLIVTGQIEGEIS